MEGKFLRRVVWYDTIFEKGKVYDLDDMLHAKLLRQHIIEVEASPEKVEPEVEQPETQSVFKPVATSIKPLPKKPVKKGKK